MKKALVILLALAMVGVAFADEPAAELKLVEFSGNAALLFGADLDTGSTAFSNTGNVNFKVQIISDGSKTSTGEGVWGELVIKTDDDPTTIKVDADPTENSLDPVLNTNMSFIIDVAKLHFPNGYIGIKKDGTHIDFVQFADMAAPYFKVDKTQYYGQLGDLWQAEGDPNTGWNAPYGFVFGYTLPELAEVNLDLRSFTKLATDGVNPEQVAVDGGLLENAYGVRAKVGLLAVENLTLEAAVSTGLGGKDAIYDLGFGGKVGYKFALDDTMYLKPNAAFNGVIDNAAGRVSNKDNKGTEDFSYVAQGGLLLGWGDKATAVDFYFFDDSDNDWGYYPGISVGLFMKSKDFDGTPSDATTGLNISMMTGTLIENLTAAVAYEIEDLQADDLRMGFAAVAKYKVAVGEKIVVPKFGINYFSDAALEDEAASDIYIKAGLDIENIFPNCTLSFEYASNDLNGGVLDGAVTDKTMGIFYTKFKIAF